jgi:hypothetical protein
VIAIIGKVLSDIEMRGLQKIGEVGSDLIRELDHGTASMKSYCNFFKSLNSLDLPGMPSRNFRLKMSMTIIPLRYLNPPK